MIAAELLKMIAGIAILVAIPLLMHLAALFWARFEIQNEGKFPWAGSLPCWKRRTGFKEVTGYHTNLSYLFLVLIVLVVIFFSAFAIVVISQNPGLLSAVLSVFSFEDVTGILLMFVSCFILIIGDEDSMWNTIHPSRKFTIKAYSRKQFPTTGTIWSIPKDYFYYALGSGLCFGVASIIVDYCSMWLWLWYLIAIISMNLITIPIEQAKNKKSGDEHKFDVFARNHVFFEGRLDSEGELVPEEAWVIVIRKNEDKIFIHVEKAEVIDPRGRYSKAYGQSNDNPDLLENRVIEEVNPETTIISLLN